MNMSNEELVVAFVLWLKTEKDIRLHILSQYGNECRCAYDEPEELASEFMEFLETNSE